MSDEPEDQPEGMWDAIYGALLSAFFILLLLLALGAFAVSLTGCTQQDRQAFGSVHTRRQMREIPTADGGKLVLEETWTETEDQATTKTGFDPVIGNALKSGLGAVGAAATGDWSKAITLGVGALATAAAGYAATQRARAVAASDLADHHAEIAAKHEADAADGWAKFAALAQAKA